MAYLDPSTLSTPVSNNYVDPSTLGTPVSNNYVDPSTLGTPVPSPNISPAGIPTVMGNGPAVNMSMTDAGTGQGNQNIPDVPGNPSIQNMPYNPQMLSPKIGGENLPTIAGIAATILTDGLDIPLIGSIPLLGKIGSPLANLLAKMGASGLAQGATKATTNYMEGEPVLRDVGTNTAIGATGPIINGLAGLAALPFLNSSINEGIGQSMVNKTASRVFNPSDFALSPESFEPVVQNTENEVMNLLRKVPNSSNLNEMKNYYGSSINALLQKMTPEQNFMDSSYNYGQNKINQAKSAYSNVTNSPTVKLIKSVLNQ